MKKTIIQYLYRIQDGGAETLVKDYALLLNKEKFNIFVMCCDINKNSSNYKILKANNINIISLYGNKVLFHKIVTRIIGKIHISKLLEKKILDIKPDIIHVHLESLEVFKYCHKVLNNITLFYTCHNVPKTMIGDDIPKEKEAASFLIKNNNLQIIALYEEMAKEINIILNIDNTLIVHNGINTSNYIYNDEINKTYRKMLNIPSDAFVVGHVGRFSYQKNHEKIIDVFNEINNLNNNSFLLLVGSGELLKKIKNKVKSYGLSNKVVFLSNRQDVAKLLDTINVFLFPSRYEGISIALIEAQAKGKYCVVSNNVNYESFFSNKIKVLDLNLSNYEWAKNCLIQTSNITCNKSIDSFDINKIVLDLENLYLSN